MNLNKEQIEKVINWMNTWEQLKNTAIPLRFKEEFTKQLILTDVSQCNDIKKPKFSGQTIIIIDRKDGLKDLYTDDGCIGVGLTNEKVK